MEPQQVKSSEFISKPVPNHVADKQGNSLGTNKELWCVQCNKSCHTNERCWKLHGKPSNKKKPQANFASGSQEKLSQTDLKGEIERLKSLIEMLENDFPSTTGTCASRFSGISF